VLLTHEPKRNLALRDENVVLREQIDQAFMFEEIVGTSSGLQGVLSRLMKVAPTDSSVLVSGETGTALAQWLISSELFGHEKGAFTGFEDHVEGLSVGGINTYRVHRAVR
jgi:transcriptional regulator with GAF, ATPase, and Fis domain